MTRQDFRLLIARISLAAPMSPAVLRPQARRPSVLPPQRLRRPARPAAGRPV